MKRKQPNNTKGVQSRLPENKVGALQLRQRGLSYREIAATIGVSLTTAYNNVQDCIKELNVIALEEAEIVRDLELARLDAALASIEVKLAKGDLGAINTLLRIQERRARFLGLDMPNKTDITVSTPEPITFVLDDHDKAE